MGIETGHHALQSILQQFLVANRFHVIGLDALEYLAQGFNFIEWNFPGAYLSVLAIGLRAVIQGDDGADKNAHHQNNCVTDRVMHSQIAPEKIVLRLIINNNIVSKF